MKIAGGHENKFLNYGKIILKRIDGSSEEDINYEILTNSHLQQFIPKYLCTIWTNRNKYIMLENLVPNDISWDIIDIKLSYIKKPPLCYRYNRRFRIVGMIVDGEQIRVNKYTQYNNQYQYIRHHLKNNRHHLPEILKTLQLMIDNITNNDRLYGSSLFIALSPNKCVIKIIDFSDFNSKTFEKRADVAIDYYDIKLCLSNLHNIYHSILINTILSSEKK